ncbi:copper chaperone PCu(A)C [Aestuariispira ectoiniformans]|uniref:copper chaperone PCu(A)C n=1 Tax=Aestuariispira ectoiniformans TaxID=2775080 RepID=UPI00223AE258|nr:copper chaperone PCu(A)C [Aestuariispira ectoiniformans]
MKRLISAAVVAAAMMSSAALAHEYKLGDLKIDHPWARASATAQAKAGGAFMTIHNMGKADDKLVSASSDVAKRVELHTHKMDANGVMKMGQVPFVPVPAEGMAELKPGSYHVMFMGLKKPFVEGENFDLTLHFEKSGDTTVSVKVESVGYGADSSMKMKHDGNKKQ